ncbi:MAG: nucleoside triphosphate pyrophosphohydrolase, partial [Chloroflexi bacterium]|nr:nucleoside triphosphate pyrophosphohydrolase [Chloroflexota bacterium]
QDRASRVGIEWPSIDEGMDKLKGVRDGSQSEIGRPMQAAEMGELLFAIVNYAREIQADPEAELQRASRRFRSRFSNMLQALADQGRELEELDLAETKRMWDDTKEINA